MPSGRQKTSSGSISVLTPPDHDWQVRYEDALSTWLEGNPNLLQIEPVMGWIKQCQLVGPPPDGVCVDGDERYLATTSKYSVVIEYLVIAFEYRVIIKRIG